MNTRLLKETRNLLPMFAGTLLLIAVPYLIFHLNDAALGYVAFGLACMVMGGSSFGNEFQHRTISLLLRSEERRVGKECRSRWSPYH